MNKTSTQTYYLPPAHPAAFSLPVLRGAPGLCLPPGRRVRGSAVILWPPEQGGHLRCGPGCRFPRRRRAPGPQRCPPAGAGPPRSPELGVQGEARRPGAPRERGPAVGRPTRVGLRHLARTKHGPSLPLDLNAVKHTTPFPARNQNGRPAPSAPSQHRRPHSRWRRRGFGRALASSQHGGRKAGADGAVGGAPPALKMAAVSMRLPVPRKAVGLSGPRGGDKHLVAPGDTITTDMGYMRWGRRGGGGRGLRAGRPAPGSPQAAAPSAGATAPTWRRRS